MTLYQVDLPYANYGVEVTGRHVTRVAPIARWMLGKAWPACQEWILKRGGKIVAAGNHAIPH